MKLRNNRFVVLASIATMTAVCLISQAGAQTTWIGNTDNNLNNAANWSAGVPTGSVNSIFTNAGSSGTSLSLTADLQFVGGTAPASNGVLFDGAGFTITGNSATRQLTIGGQGLAINTTNTITIDAPRVRRNASNTFEFLGSSGNLVINGDFSTNITAAADTLTRVDFSAGDNSTLTFNGNIVNVFTGAAGAGLGNLTISSVGTGNKVVLNNTSNIGYTGAVSIGNNAQLHLGSGGTNGTLAGAASISLGNSVSAFVINQSDTVTQGTEFASTITGAGKLEQKGAGTTILNSTTGYTGETIVSGGKLMVNGNISTSSLTTVAVGATLGGVGTVGKTIVNGTLAVGNSPGTMTFTNTLGLNGTTIMEIDGTAGAGVTGGHDFANLTGSGAAGVLTYGGSMTLDMGVIFGTGSYSWNLFDMASETGTFTTIALADQYSGSLLDDDLNGVWDLTSGVNTWQFTESTGVLGLTVIPEPRAALLGGLGMLALLCRRRA